jgi:hypothetical protein
LLQLKKGIPTDKSQVDKYITEMKTERNLFVQWLEDFRSKYGQYPEAEPTITEVEAALQLYKDVVEAVQVKLDIQKARDAKRAQGSVLEYGLEWHLERFINEVRLTQLN